MSIFLRVEKGLRRCEYTIAALSLCVIVFATAVGVVSRYVFNSPIIWTSELSLLAQVWLTFFGASAVYKDRGHVGIGGLIEKCPPALARALSVFVDLTIAAILLIVACSEIDLIKMQNHQTIATLGIPRSASSLPVAFAMISISYSAIVGIFFGASQSRTEENPDVSTLGSVK